MEYFDIRKMPVNLWRNGAGETREICCFPPATRDFHWRASIASIAANGEFSLFPGVERVITLLEGAVLGGGFGLACISDVAIADTNAKLAMPETGLGIPPAQIAPFVTERVGLTQARRLMLTGARFKGEEAVQYGIGHILAEDAADLEIKCAEVLAQIALCAPGANAVTKSIVFEATRLPRAEALDFASRGFARCMLSDEGREGVAAFVEKRKPKWATE